MTQIVSIPVEDYLECIGFTTYAYLEDKIVKRDLMKGSERSLGEFLEHFIRGKLAELAFKRYIQNSSGIESLTDVDLPVFIEGEYLPDLLALKTNKDWINARFWIEVKAVIAKQKWMLISTTSVAGGKRSQPRPFCAYVECLVDLPQDHVARLIKYVPQITERMSNQWQEKLGDLRSIDVTVLGYALYQDIDSILANRNLDSVFGKGNYGYLAKHKTVIDQETGERYGGFNRDNCAIRLSRLRLDWKPFIRQMKANTPLAPTTSRNLPNFDREMNSALKVLSEQGYTSWFKRELKGKRVEPKPFSLTHLRDFMKK